MSFVPAQTSGVGVATHVIVDANTITLNLGGTATHQITATAKDAAGTTQSATFNYVSYNTDIATVSGTGLITAVKKGHARIEVCTAVAGTTATISSVGNPMHGLPSSKIETLIDVFVRP